jgi:plastocyanin
MTYPIAIATRVFSSAALLAGCLLVPSAAFAEAAKPQVGAGPPPGEVDRLRKEVADLRKMLIESKQLEQQNRDLLLKLVPAGTRTGTAVGPAAAGPGAGAAAAPVVSTGTITGTVHLSGVSSKQPVYVFVENLAQPPVRGHSVDITQREKQFWPQAIAVQRGTTAFFPNVDHVTHNVFAAGPPSTFDLGQIPSRERGKPVVLGEPGVVKIYCDVHPGMWSEVLVTPNGHFTRVSGANFRLKDVPVGDRVIAVWTAGAEPSRQTVALTPQGATLDFVLNVPLRKGGHPNKAGQTYSSTAP